MTKQSVRPNGKQQPQMQTPQLPLYGTYQVTTGDGKVETHPDCFIQLGTQADIPGALLIFHMTGAFTLAAYAPGHWSNVKRMKEWADIARAVNAPEATETAQPEGATA